MYGVKNMLLEGQWHDGLFVSECKKKKHLQMHFIHCDINISHNGNVYIFCVKFILYTLYTIYYFFFSNKIFERLLAFLFSQVELPPPDLGPTASLTQTLSLLREVLASHDSSVLPLDARQADFAQVTFLFMFFGKIHCVSTF